MTDDYIILTDTDVNNGTFMSAKNTIVFFNSATNNEMLKVSPNGFYVRGVKVAQDENEAETVYKTFHQWLTWATLNRSF